MARLLVSSACAIALATLLGCGSTGQGAADSASRGDGNASSGAGSGDGAGSSSSSGSGSGGSSGSSQQDATASSGGSSGGDAANDAANDQTSEGGGDATVDVSSGDAADSSSNDATADQTSSGAGDGSASDDGSGDAPTSSDGPVAEGGGGLGCPLSDAAFSLDVASSPPDAALDAPKDAVTEAPPAGVDRYVSPTGNDSHAGTSGAPLLTIAKAASLAQAGDRILLLDGLYDGTTQPAFNVNTTNSISLPDGVSVSAVNPRAVTLRGWGSGTAFVAAGSATFTGLSFEVFSIAIQANVGTLLVSGTTFSKCGQGSGGVIGALELSGSVNATVTPGGVSNYIVPPSYGFAALDLNAHLTVSGGTLQGMSPISYSGSSAFFVDGGSSLILDGVTVVSGGTPVAVTDQGSVILQNGSVIRGFSTAAVYVFENDIFQLLSGSTLEQNGIGVRIQNGGGNSRVGAYVTLDQGIVTNNTGNGIESDNGAVLLSLTVNRSLIAGNGGSGIALGDASSISATSTVITNNGGYGLKLLQPITGATVYDCSVTLRGNQVTGNASAGVSISGWASLTPGFDLGKVSSPGGNTFMCNNTLALAGMANVVVPSSPIATVFAVGNNWAPSVQGADAAGHYNASGAGATLEVSSGSGTNYAVTSSTLRLAQNP